MFIIGFSFHLKIFLMIFSFYEILSINVIGQVWGNPVENYNAVDSNLNYEQPLNASASNENPFILGTNKKHHETNCPSQFLNYSLQFDTINQFLKPKSEMKNVSPCHFPPLPTGNNNPLIDFTFRHLIINFRWAKSLNSFNSLEIQDQVSYFDYYIWVLIS